jgi:cytochrome c oxidase subunit IV
MTEHAAIQESHEQEQDHDPHPAYGKLWFALLILTVLEYFYAMFAKDHFVGLVIGLMILATIKAGLVGAFFMHLKYEGNWVYIWLLPAAFLLCVFMGGLYPDIGRQKPPEISDEDQEAILAPVNPGPASHLLG